MVPLLPSVQGESFKAVVLPIRLLRLVANTHGLPPLALAVSLRVGPDRYSCGLPVSLMAVSLRAGPVTSRGPVRERWAVSLRVGPGRCSCGSVR